MSHTGGYSYAVHWKSNSPPLSVPSPAAHKERAVKDEGGVEAEDTTPEKRETLCAVKSWQVLSLAPRVQTTPSPALPAGGPGFCSPADPELSVCAPCPASGK